MTPKYRRLSSQSASAEDSAAVKSVHEAVLALLGRLNAVFTSSLLVIIVLTFVVDNGIREHQIQASALMHTQRQAGLRAARSKQHLRDVRAAFFKDIEATATKLGERNPQSPHEATGLTPEILETFAGALTITSTAAEWQKAATQLDNLSASKSAYASAQRWFVDYGRNREVMVTDHVRAVEAKAQLRTFESEKESVPTPFGSFAASPRLALLALGFAAVLAYLAMEHLARRTLDMARRAAQGSLSERAPSWLYVPPSDPQALLAFGWTEADRKQNARRAIAVHASWLLVCVAILIECFHWRAFHASHLGSPVFAEYALIVLNALALAKLLMLPIEAQSSTPAAVRGRRLAIIFLIAAPAVCLAWIRRRAITGIRHNRFTRGTQLARVAPPEKSLSSPGVLMRNTQTDVVHSTIVCINHLPKKKHRDNELKGGWLHGAHESMILDACAQELEDEMNQVISRSSSRIPARKGRHATPFGISPDQQVKEQREKIVRLIERAISLRPDAYHLYDYLIRIHRESGEVDRAHDALQRQLQRVEANLRIASTQIPKSSVARRHPKSKMLTNRLEMLKTRLINAKSWKKPPIRRGRSDSGSLPTRHLPGR